MNFVQIHPVDVEMFHWMNKHLDHPRILETKTDQQIKVKQILHLGAINIMAIYPVDDIFTYIHWFQILKYFFFASLYIYTSVNYLMN